VPDYKKSEGGTVFGIIVNREKQRLNKNFLLLWIWNFVGSGVAIAGI
jgi:hypothetical protein